MADVFISYAREDRARAAQLADALAERGWSVWWDRSIAVGQAFDQVLERELEAAQRVVVLWSRHAVASEWVRNEAAVAAEWGRLLPVLLDDVSPPLPFRHRQAADLTDWRGDPSHPGFQALCEALATLHGAAQPPPLTAPPRRPRLQAGIVATVTLLAVAAGLGVYAFGPWHTRPPALPPDSPPGSPTAEAAAPPGAAADLAALVVGRYAGAVIADAEGGSRSDVDVTVTRVDRTTVRITSSYSRLDTIDVSLTRVGNQVLQAAGDTPFVVDLDRHPPTLIFDPHGVVAYRGTKQQ